MVSRRRQVRINGRSYVAVPVIGDFGRETLILKPAEYNKGIRRARRAGVGNRLGEMLER